MGDGRTQDSTYIEYTTAPFMHVFKMWSKKPECGQMWRLPHSKWPAYVSFIVSRNFLFLPKKSKELSRSVSNRTRHMKPAVEFLFRNENIVSGHLLLLVVI